MITPEMFATMDWSISTRRAFYGRLSKIADQMRHVGRVIRRSERKGGRLDLCISDDQVEIWIALSRRDAAPDAYGFPNADLDVIEYLIEWATGVRNYALADIERMDARYPELSRVPESQLVTPTSSWKDSAQAKWLKRAFKRLF
jgi:hypothetical protein